MKAVLALIALVATVVPATAQTAAPTAPEDASLVERTLYKTLSYQALSTLDDFAFGYMVRGIAAGGALALANSASEVAVIYAHDLTWSLFLQGRAASEAATRMTRTATYTAVNALRVFGLGMLLTRDPLLSLGYVGFNSVADAGVYWVNDLGWEMFWPVGQSMPQR